MACVTIAERIKLLEKKGLNDTNNCQAIKKSKVDKVIQGNGQSNKDNVKPNQSFIRLFDWIRVLISIFFCIFFRRFF